MSSIQGEIPQYELVQKYLEALVVDNPELEKLEALLDEFNIFEAIGVVRQEMRHSDFLAFLLDPQQNHGLGDTFLKRLLQKALISASNSLTPITPIDLDVWSLDQVLVLREWRNIDIVLIDELNKLIIILENKINISEHSDQLRRYYEDSQQHYPNSKIIGLFLTPEGEMPSDDRYLPVNYGQICSLLESLLDSRASTLGADVLTAISHYIQIVRRHVVNESEMIELCHRIYRKHRKALDVIYEYRPDQQEEIREILEKVIQQSPHLKPDYSIKSYIRFTCSEWDIPDLLQGNGWTPSGRILLFEFYWNSLKDLKIKLTIGPGPLDIRQKLLNMALQKPSLFKPDSKKLGNKWKFIYNRTFLTAKSYEDVSDDELTEQINKHWNAFVQGDLQALRTAICEELNSWYPNDIISLELSQNV
jgi:PD-(D/E)XK nuclease superfamily